MSRRRKGPGRPSLSRGGRSPRISVSLDETTLTRLVSEAHQVEASASQLAREVIEDADLRAAAKRLDERRGL